MWAKLGTLNWTPYQVMMESLKEKVVAWIRKDLSSDGQLDWAAYNNSLVMVRMEGTDFRLSGEWVPDGWHVFFYRCTKVN